MESNTLELSVFSPERALLRSARVSEVTLTGSEGEIQILPGHAAMVGTLETGRFAYRLVDSQGGEKATQGVVSTGFFEVSAGRVTVMAETLELDREIDLARAKTAQERAEQKLASGDATLDEHQFRKYQLKLQRALIRQQVAGR